MEINNIYCMDCIDGIQSISDEIHLCITSPPYNIGTVATHNFIEYATYEDNKEYGAYIYWLRQIFLSLYDKMSDDGRVCINIGSLKNGQIPTHFYITQFMLEIGYSTYTTIIWNKSQVARRTAWGSWLSPSSPSFPTPFEYILIFYKKYKKLQRKGETDLERQEFIDWTLARPDGIFQEKLA